MIVLYTTDAPKAGAEVFIISLSLCTILEVNVIYFNIFSTVSSLQFERLHFAPAIIFIATFSMLIQFCTSKYL